MLWRWPTPLIDMPALAGAGSDVENSKEDPSKVTGQASNLDGGSNGQDDQDQPSTSGI